jgi:excisionase family DNA binding protein
MPTPSKLHQSTSIPWQERAALSVEHAAEILGLSRKNAYNLVAAGRIRAVKIGDKRLIVPVAEIRRLINLEPSPRRPRPRRASTAATKEATATV